MKPTGEAKPILFIISKMSMIAATIISSRSVSNGFKAIRTFVLVIVLAAGVAANTDADPASLTGFHVVPSPFISNSSLFGTAAIADSVIWAVGDIVSGNTAQTLAERFNGTSWNVVPTPAVQGGEFAAVDGVASNDVWAVGQQ